MVKVSVIVPVYNVEKYLPKCLDSLVEQTFINYEVIVINDGSTDKSEQIIIDYQFKYPSIIKYYKKQNGGLSDARNFGIEKSSGSYIMFVDSDDYVSNDMIEKLYNCVAEKESEIALCNIIKVASNGKEVKISNYNPGTVNLSQDHKILFNSPVACNKIYKKTLFDKNKFDKGKYYEDLRLIPKLYLEAKNIAFIDDFCYYYVDRSNSIMHDVDLKRNFEIVDAIDSIIGFYEKKGKYVSYKDAIEYMMIDNVIISTFVRIIRSQKNYKECLSDYWRFIDEKFPNYQKNKYIRLLSFRRKLVFFLNSHKLYGVTKLLFKIKR